MLEHKNHIYHQKTIYYQDTKLSFYVKLWYNYVIYKSVYHKKERSHIHDNN